MKNSEFMTIEEKERVIKHFKKFVSGGFKELDFTKALYDHFHLHCGFIAHYNKDGFYQARFGNHKGFVQTIVQLSEAHRHGGQDYRDVNKALSDTLASFDAASIIKKGDLSEVQRILSEIKANVGDAISLSKGCNLNPSKIAIQQAIEIIERELLTIR